MLKETRSIYDAAKFLRNTVAVCEKHYAGLLNTLQAIELKNVVGFDAPPEKPDAKKKKRPAKVNAAK